MSKPCSNRLLTIPVVAERLGTGERFVRRLIEERRIEFVKIGRHVRVRESAVSDYIDAGTIPAARSRRVA